MKNPPKIKGKTTRKIKLRKFVSMVDRVKHDKTGLMYNGYYYSGIIGEL